jgi:hypothetical protein
MWDRKEPEDHRVHKVVQDLLDLKVLKVEEGLKVMWVRKGLKGR